LPKPAGADTNVSATSAPRSRRWVSRGRAMEPRRRLAMCSLVSSSGPDMPSPLGSAAGPSGGCRAELTVAAQRRVIGRQGTASPAAEGGQCDNVRRRTATVRAPARGPPIRAAGD
jgi:hypothetical protein